MIKVEKSRWILECPCTNDKLATQKLELINPLDFNIKKEQIGAFYSPKVGPMFDNLFFKEDSNYNGPLMLNSPLKVFLEITEKCNLNCSPCYLTEKNNNEGNMENLEKILNELSKTKVIGVEFLGGEPTCFPHLSELCTIAKSMGLEVEIVSNGYEVKPKLIDNLVGNVDLFTISIDGSKENHNLIRQNSKSYDNAMQTIKNLVSAGIPSGVLMTLNKLNYKDMPRIGNSLDKRVRFSVKMMIPPRGGLSSDLILSKDDAKEVKKICEDYNIQTYSFISGFGSSGNYSFFGCPGGKIHAVINVKGDVFPCLYKRKENIIGNVFKESLKDIWINNNFYKTNNKPAACDQCKSNKRCGGFCRLPK